MEKKENIFNLSVMSLNDSLDKESLRKENEFFENVYFSSYDKLELAKKMNLYLSIFLIIAGLIGHMLTILVFAQNRFRRNSANVFLLLLAVS
jgi:hypothetical protein